MSDGMVVFQNLYDSGDIKRVDFNEDAIDTAAKLLISQKSTIYFESRAGHYDIILPKDCYRTLAISGGRTVWFARPKKADRTRLDGTKAKFQKLNHSGSGIRADKLGGNRRNQLLSSGRHPTAAGQQAQGRQEYREGEPDSGIS
jgi:hypothetical protein